MSYWVELHCDLRMAPDCASHHGRSINLLVPSNNVMLLYAAADLGRQAREQGWRRSRRGWACDACMAKLPPCPRCGVNDHTEFNGPEQGGTEYCCTECQSRWVQET